MDTLDWQQATQIMLIISNQNRTSGLEMAVTSAILMHAYHNILEYQAKPVQDFSKLWQIIAIRIFLFAYLVDYKQRNVATDYTMTVIIAIILICLQSSTILL